MNVKVRDKHVTDLYILANDILENFYQQRDGYKGSFYYAFNNSLKFLLCDSSDIEQTKLLRQLADRDMLDFKNEELPPNIPDDFIGKNAQKNNSNNLYYLSIKPDVFNKQFKLLKKYKLVTPTNEDIPLPKVVTKITDKFKVHENNIISYDGIPIELEPQTSKIIALIMSRSINQQYTSIQTITDECLSEAYLSKVSSEDVNAAADYIRRCISNSRGKFRIATRSNKTKNFFLNKHGIGYTFKP